MSTEKAAPQQEVAVSALPSSIKRHVGLKCAPVEVEFKGLFSVRLLLGEDGRRRFEPAAIADRLGASASGAKQRARRSYPKGWCIMHPPSAGGPQSVLAVDLKYLPAFLLGFQASRVREQVRPRLEEIQEELYDALAAYTFEGVAVNPAFGGAPPLSGLGEVRASLAEHIIPAALRTNDFDTARSAMAALEAMLSRSNSPMSSPLPVPRPKAPRGPAAPISSPTPSASAQAKPKTSATSPARGEALKRLRLRLGLTQEQMAEKGGLGRVDVCRVEGGHNMASSQKMHKGLAQAAALSTDDLSDYLDGKIDIEEVMRRRTAPPPGPQLRLITSAPGEQGGAPQAGSRGQS